jgi:signal transduction histidine kinase
VVAIRAISVAVAVALIGVALAVSWEIVRVATARRRSARLVSDLSTAAGPGRLRKELAAITHDDSLDILFPLTDRVVDFSGRTITDPRLDGDDRTRRISVAIGEDGGEVAVLTHRAGLLDDSGFRDAVARAAGLALEHERLQAELISRMADLRQSRADLVASFDGERRRLERDLHDGAQQQVVALLLQLRLANTRHPDPNLEEAIVEVLAALDDLRRLAHGLFPAALAEDGLVAALDELREGAAIPIRLTGVLEHRLPLDVETTAYVVVAETLQRGRLDAVDVDVSAADGIAAITVTGVRRAADARTGPRDGVVGLADRVGAIGGWLHIDDRADALTVRAELPCVS